MTSEALIGYVAGRLEALMKSTGKDDSVSSISCDLMQCRRECAELLEKCVKHLELNRRLEEKGNDE